jgi:hypothetical protein
VLPVAVHAVVLVHVGLCKVGEHINQCVQHTNFKIQKLKKGSNLQHLKLLLPTDLKHLVENLSETALEATINQIEYANSA